LAIRTLQGDQGKARPTAGVLLASDFWKAQHRTSGHGQPRTNAFAISGSGEDASISVNKTG
jgi:hypothetical protein